MSIFQYFRHDWQQNVIKRSPPPRLARILKNAWDPGKDYPGIFENNNSTQADRGELSNADMEYSSIRYPFRVPFHSSPKDPENASGVRNLKFKYYLPFRKIDPRIVSSALATAPKINKKILTNVINHLHFTREYVSIHVQDIMSGQEFLQQAEPGPCFNDQVTIRLTDPGIFDLKRHAPLNLVIDNRKSLIVFPINLQAADRESLMLNLPDVAHSYSKRQAVRHTCEGVKAEIVQGKLNVHGVLEDINPHDFRICIDSPEDINSANNLFLKLSQDNQTNYMGECRLLRIDKENSYIILQPVHHNRPVLSPRKYAGDRVRIMPQPVIHFIHPLCGLAVQNKVEDISASGFSVLVSENESLLIPGMIIPQMTIQLPGMFNDLQCAAQVVYRLKLKKDILKYGFYILDMSLNDQKRLFDAVSKASDPHVNVTGRVNMDSLWELFFDSGFIYPNKYGLISPFKESLKETYRKLYDEGQDIFTHLTYQDHGQIYGHLSMVKAYENSWIIHHLAARALQGKRTGLKTLNYFINYLDCLYRLPVSSKTMRYNFCYYRPENQFSDYYFGGVCKIFKRREICSMDLFGYMPMDIAHGDVCLPENWSIEKFSRKDLAVMREYYDGIGGGMMLDAYALECRAAENENCHDTGSESTIHNDNIMSMYNKIGLKRESSVFSVRHNGMIKAALIVDTSDLGVNMSELLNSIKIIVIDNTLPWAILQDAVSAVGKAYHSDSIMVLIFPFEYLGQQGVKCEKRYNLWVLNTNLDSPEMDIIKDRAKITKRKFITEKFVKEISKRRQKRLLAKLEQQK